jgi:hypothetical protein
VLRYDIAYKQNINNYLIKNRVARRKDKKYIIVKVLTKDKY